MIHSNTYPYGYLVEEDTAAKIAEYLDDYNALLESRLKDKLDETERDQLTIDSLNIDEICKTFRGYYKENDE